MTTKITAHRGDSEFYPENTVAAFQSAAKKGADRIELDAHMSADGKIVVHHDYELGRTNDGSGYVHEQPSDYLKSLGIPLLEDVFKSVRFKGEYEIELKATTVEFLEDVISLVRQNGLFDRVEFTSPHQLLLARLRELEPEATIGLFIPKFPEWMGQELGLHLVKSQLGLGIANVAHCAIEDVSLLLVESVHQAGYKIHIANAPDEKALKAAFELGVDQVSTNYLGLAIKVRSQYGQ